MAESSTAVRNRRRKTPRGELLGWQRRRTGPGTVHSRGPEVLVALEGADHGRTGREQTGRGRPRPSVMDDSGNTREQPAMRRALDDQHLGVVVHAAQSSPPTGDHRADPG